MVITNYEAVLRDKITQRIADCYEPMLRAALSSEFFAELVIKLYEYCEELNMIKRKVEKLKFTTGKNEVVMPQLISSQITRIDSKAKEISTSYSLFLFKQKKFKVRSNEGKFYEQLLETIVEIVVGECFRKEDYEHLSTEVNRLFRTNTFSSAYWKNYEEKYKKDHPKRKKSDRESQFINFRGFRRTVRAQSSQIKPYVNNKSCFKSLQSRSPVVSLWHPNNQYLSFSLTNKHSAKKKAVEL